MRPPALASAPTYISLCPCTRFSLFIGSLNQTLLCVKPTAACTRRHLPKIPRMTAASGCRVVAVVLSLKSPCRAFSQRSEPRHYCICRSHFKMMTRYAGCAESDDFAASADSRRAAISLGLGHTIPPTIIRFEDLPCVTPGSQGVPADSQVAWRHTRGRYAEANTHTHRSTVRGCHEGMLPLDRVQKLDRLCCIAGGKAERAKKNSRPNNVAARILAGSFYVFSLYFAYR